MSLPAGVSMENPAGKYSLNRELSDDQDPIFEMVSIAYSSVLVETLVDTPPLQQQGFGWLKRKAISKAPVSLQMSRTTDPATGTDILVTKNLVAGREMMNEERHLDSQTRDVEVADLGTLRVKSEWLTLADINSVGDDFLRSGWVADGGKLIHIVTDSVSGGWRLEHVWGVQEVKAGDRRYVRKLFIKKAGDERRAKFVYDYVA
jgi:hypothetical protein